MDSLSNLLARHPLPEEPAEVRLIKHYAQEQFQSSVQVQLSEEVITIVVRSSSLANALRLRVPEIKRICGTTRRISVRIGSTS